MAAHFHTELRIEASPQQVWEVLTDLEAYPQWNPMAKQAQGRLEVGAKLLLHLAALPFPVGAQIRALDPGRLLRWGGGASIILDVEHYFEVHPDGEHTRFVHGEIFGGLLGPLIARLAGINNGLYEHYNQKLALRVASI